MFRKIGYTLLSMFTVFKHLFKQPVTLEYPEEKLELNEYFRGLPVVNQCCIKCGTCVKVCPVNAIKIVEDKFIIDLKRCIFCGNCSFYCPKNAISMSQDYELATKSKENLSLVYDIKKLESLLGGEDERNI